MCGFDLIRFLPLKGMVYDNMNTCVMGIWYKYRIIRLPVSSEVREWESVELWWSYGGKKSFSRTTFDTFFYKNEFNCAEENDV